MTQDRWAGATSGERGDDADTELEGYSWSREKAGREAPTSSRSSSWWWARVTVSEAVPFQAEDEALLSEEDDPIDRRPWTQQHLEAADIRRTPSLALTPPQAEQEVDVLDVNVRGPGQHPRLPSTRPCLPLALCLPSLVPRPQPISQTQQLEEMHA